MADIDKDDLSLSRLPTYALRIKPSLRRQLDSAAKEHGRSLNAEISARLEASFVESSPENDDQSKLAVQRLLKVGGHGSATGNVWEALASEVHRLKVDVAALKSKVGI